MKKLVTSPTFKFLIGTLVFLLPGGSVILIAAALYTKSSAGRTLSTRFTPTSEAA